MGRRNNSTVVPSDSFDMLNSRSALEIGTIHDNINRLIVKDDYDTRNERHGNELGSRSLKKNAMVNHPSRKIKLSVAESPDVHEDNQAADE